MKFKKDQFPKKFIPLLVMEKEEQEKEEKEEKDKLAINMQDFCKEITELKIKKFNKEIEGMFEILNVNPDNLTEEDAYFWNKLKNNPNLITNFESYYSKNYSSLVK